MFDCTFLAGCENNIIIGYEIKIVFRHFDKLSASQCRQAQYGAWSMEHGAWGLNCTENNICANKKTLCYILE